MAGERGLPSIDPARGGCTFCNACIEACPTEALRADRLWPWRAQLRDSCLAFNAIACSTCADFCTTGAISLHPRRGSAPQPQVDQDRCTGCAECVGACPASAISLRRIEAI